MAKIWFHKKNCLLIYRNDTIAEWIATLVRMIDPR